MNKQARPITYILHMVTHSIKMLHVSIHKPTIRPLDKTNLDKIYNYYTIHGTELRLLSTSTYEKIVHLR